VPKPVWEGAPCPIFSYPDFRISHGGLARAQRAAQGTMIFSNRCAGLSLVVFLHALGMAWLVAGDAPKEADPNKGKPVSPPPDSQRPPTETGIKAWIAELGSDEFQKREAAMKKILEVGDIAHPILSRCESDDNEIKNRLKILLEHCAPPRAAERLKELCVTQQVWRGQDIDKNGESDYWTRDIAAFYAVRDAGSNVVRLISRTLACADAAPGKRYPEIGTEPMPACGYFFRVLKTDPDGKPYVQVERPEGIAENIPAGACSNASRFAFCAYPARYWSGRLTYILSETGVVWQKDLGPDVKGVNAWPHPEKEGSGWSRFGG
jgi:hypothetical protein